MLHNFLVISYACVCYNFKLFKSSPQSFLFHFLLKTLCRYLGYKMMVFGDIQLYFWTFTSEIVCVTFLSPPFETYSYINSENLGYIIGHTRQLSSCVCACPESLSAFIFIQFCANKMLSYGRATSHSSNFSIEKTLCA